MKTETQRFPRLLILTSRVHNLAVRNSWMGLLRRCSRKKGAAGLFTISSNRGNDIIKYLKVDSDTLSLLNPDYTRFKSGSSSRDSMSRALFKISTQISSFVLHVAHEIPAMSKTASKNLSHFQMCTQGKYNSHASTD